MPSEEFNDNGLIVDPNEIIQKDQVAQIIKDHRLNDVVEYVHLYIKDFQEAGILWDEDGEGADDDLEQILLEELEGLRGKSEYELAAETLGEEMDWEEKLQKLKGLSREQPPLFSEEELKGIVTEIIKGKNKYMQNLRASEAIHGKQSVIPPEEPSI